jgi:hypothetical protein
MPRNSVSGHFLKKDKLAVEGQLNDLDFVVKNVKLKVEDDDTVIQLSNIKLGVGVFGNL